MEYAVQDTRGDYTKSEQFQRSVMVPVTTLSPENSEEIECFTDVSTCNSVAGLPKIFDHVIQISSRLNAFRDACSSVLGSCVEIEKRP